MNGERFCIKLSRWGNDTDNDVRKKRERERIMIEFFHIVKDPNGIHARPAGLLAREALQYQSDITVKKGERYANMKGLFSMMSLAVKAGDTITVSVSGKDESIAAEALRKYLEEHI